MARSCIVCLLIASFLVSACNEEPKQRSYSAFVACTKKAGFRAFDDDNANRRLFPPWLEDVATLKSPLGNYVVVMFVTREEALARARQRVHAAITTLGPAPQKVSAESNRLVAVSGSGRAVRRQLKIAALRGCL
jgi:hypothetical protein